MSAAGPKGDAGRADRLVHAIHYAELGYRTFPLRVRIQADEDGELEKKLFPVLDWPRVATCDPAKVESWWGEGKPFATASIGVVTGASGIAVIDPDGPEGLAAWQHIRDLYGISDDTPHYSTPGGGQHWWYRTDPERPLVTGSNTVADHVDTRGGYGTDGNGLVIVPPSVDDRGAYEWIVEPVAADELPPVPEAVYALMEDRRGARPRDGEPIGIGDGTRRYTLAQAQAFVRPAIEALERSGRGERNDRLNAAARLVAHFGGEFWSREQAEQRLAEVARARGLDATEIAKTIDSAYKAQARDYASGEVDQYGRPKGWVATYVEPSPFGDDEGDADAPDPFEDDVAREVRRLAVREEAQRRLRSELGDEVFVAEEKARLQVREAAREQIEMDNRPDFRALRGAAFLKQGAALDYLVAPLLYEASTAKIYGPPGAGKTHLALDLAMGVATGHEWRTSKRIEPRTVHYLMAEGEAVNRLRVAAYVKHHELADEALEHFVAYPEGVLLTPEGVKRYLDDVAKDQPALVMLDTKNAMMAGDENSASDVGVMIRAMRMIRDVGQGTCVVLIDHTGLADESRGRGSNAVTAAMDTEIRVTKRRRAGAVIYEAEVTRDKASGEVDFPRFAFSLWPVDVERPDGVPEPPRVEWDDKLLEREPDIAPIDRRWWEVPLGELPFRLQEMRGSGDDAARSIYRVLLVTNDPDGLTRADVFSAIHKDSRINKDVVDFSDSTLKRAWARLKAGEEIEEGFMVTGSTASRWVVNPDVRAGVQQADGFGSNPRSGMGSENEA